MVYFYIDGSNRQLLSIDTLYKSFVYQVALQLPGLPYELDKKLRYGPIEDREFRRLYKKLLKNFSKIYIVIDGLDECQEFIEFDDMVQVLADLLDPEIQLTNILASSRPLEQLRRSLKNLDALQISSEEDAAHVDIETAVHSQLSGTTPFKRWPQALRNNIESTLLSGARGS